jgi:ribonuclease HII
MDKGEVLIQGILKEISDAKELSDAEREELIAIVKEAWDSEMSESETGCMK